jgi:arylsulfatase A-like enzyme
MIFPCWFSQFYATVPVCSPSRDGRIFGRNPNRSFDCVLSDPERLH